MKYHILVIDDDNSLRLLLEQYLQKNSFLVSIAGNAEEARLVMSKYIVDILILDRMMPNETGIEFMEKLRNLNNLIPIIMLTAMGEVENKIEGLEGGADDYLSKPFEPKELILRIRNIMCRVNKGVVDVGIFRFQDYIFNYKISEIKKDGMSIILSDTECKILKIFCKNFNKIISREYISKMLNGIEERSIDVQINRIRKKIEPNSKFPQYLRTIRSNGYVLYN